MHWDEILNGDNEISLRFRVPNEFDHPVGNLIVPWKFRNLEICGPRLI
jgi:hypothetical protein